MMIPKMWGREIVLHNGDYCCKMLQYDGVRTSSIHYHNGKNETFVVAQGEFYIEWWLADSTEEWHGRVFRPGEALVLPPRTVHVVRCMSEEGGTLVEASTHDDPDDCVRLAPSINPFGGS